MIKERFMVTANIIDTREQISGYITFIGRKSGHIQIMAVTDLNGIQCMVIPETVIPVAIPVKRERTPVGEYRCPNCDAAFIEIPDGWSFSSSGWKTNYCGNCGQRLAWE